jgi:tetratricopeptide (TPR) repeat protein
MYKKPPDEVPDGLSPREYQRLVTVYTLMGKHAHAVRAQAHLTGSERDNERRMTFGGSAPGDDKGGVSQPGSASDSGSGAASTKEPQYRTFELGQQAGSRFAESFMKLLNQISRDEQQEKNGGKHPDESEQDDSNALEEMKQQLCEIGLTETEAEEYVQKLSAALSDMNRQEPPPREVPEDLDAQKYYELALRYKQVGWTEQARDALNMAIELDGDGEYGKKASCFLRSKIPRHPVPLMAEQLNIQGYNQMFTDEVEAQQTFEHLVKEYPDFEWPYGNLGSLLIKRADLVRAEQLLIQSVQINPYYINGWLHLSRVYAIESRFAEADDCLKRVTDIDSDDPSWRGIRDLIEQLKKDS